MDKKWFVKKGWLYLPVSFPGAIISIIFLAFCVHIFLFVDSRSHSVSDTFYGIFPFVIPAFLLYLWIGNETCKK